MSINDTDLADLDPTEADLIAAEAEDTYYEDGQPEDYYDYLDFDSNYRDDRYDTDGVPAWSAWA